MADDLHHPAGEPRPLTLATADGVELEAELALPAEPWGAVVLAHPHPLQGGSMRSLVTSELFRALPGEGLAAVRFNFRGVGRSGGTHGQGEAERHDVVAAIDALAAATPARPLVLAGWSFGADVAATVGDERLAGWCLLAPPLRTRPEAERVAARDPRPTLVVVPEHDPFLPPGPAAEAVAGWAATELVVVAGADHFLVGRTAKAVELLVSFVRGLA